MNNDIIKLLELECFRPNIKSINVTKENNTIFCYVTLNRSTSFCPFCGGVNLSIKEYRIRKIKHSVINRSSCYLIYRARRYKCKYCNSTFYEKNPFSNRYDKCSTYTILKILLELKDHTKTFTSVARDLFLSPTAVIKIFDDCVDYNRTRLPEIICFDEVYTSKKLYNKYAFIMADFFKSKIIEVYSSRRKDKLTQNFSVIPKEERDNVKYIIIDMWESYKDLAKIYFKNAKIAVDSFHVIQHLNNAMIAIRLKIMRKFDKRSKSLLANDEYYYMLRKFHYFFVKDYGKIYDGLIEIRKFRTKWTKDFIRKYLLSIDEDLTYAYYLKEEYREFSLTANYETCDDEFESLIDKFTNSHLEEFREFGKLLIHWKENIKNSFIRINNKRLSNGPIEGINSKVKTMMKEANGFINFSRFRNRVIYSINKDVPFKNIK